MRARSTYSLILALFWLFVVALVSGRIAYGQFCYGSGATNWVETSFDVFQDNQCSQYGLNIFCEEHVCSVSGCGSGVFRQCHDIDTYCEQTACGGQICA